MSAKWHFNEIRPGDRTRESQVEKFFKSEGDRANPIVREGIQNSLDAAPDDKIVRVRLTLGRVAAPQGRQLWNKYASQLNSHLESLGDKLPDFPQTNEEFRYLVFEDFATSGLKGDPAQWQMTEGVKNGFFEFFRAEGVSTKEGSSRGRHGVGKFVFMAASRVRTIFGLTRRDDRRELLMGTTVLRHHQIGDKHYMPDGWYGIDDPNPQSMGNVLPIEQDRSAVDEFKRDFHVSRTNESGLTVVVPWLDPDVKRDSLIQAVVEGYFFPLMRNLLVVEVVDESGQVERIDHLTLREVVKRQGESYTKKVTPRLQLAAAALESGMPLETLVPEGENSAPYWTEACFNHALIHTVRKDLNAGELVALRCPTRVRVKAERVSKPSHFMVYLRRDFTNPEFDAHFIRQGILVSETRPRRIPGLRGLVVIDDGPLADFLGDAENPAHTQWLSENVKRYSFNKATIEYVVNSIENIVHFCSEEQDAPDPLPMKDLFFLPEDAGDPTHRKKKFRQKEGPEPPVVPPIPPPPPRTYRLSKIEGGFVVGRGDAGAPRPISLIIQVAYDTQRGNPFKKYHPADFVLGKGGVALEHEGCALECDSNRLSADIQSDDFEIKVTGFDPNRDLIVKPKIVTAAASEEDDNAEEV